MSVVKLALSRPYTFVVVAILILLLGVWDVKYTPKDIFPDIALPIVSIVWTYTGLTAEEFDQRITTISEIYLSNYVSGIARIDSQTLTGYSVIRLFFQPDVEISNAIGQATSISQTVLRRMPVGVQPPLVVLYSPSTVPIIQVLLSSDTLTELEILDYALYRLRPQIAVIKGVTIPLPYGGKIRELMVDVDPAAVQARGLSPREINEAINFQSVILPTGDAKIGDIDYLVNLNNTPVLPEDYNMFPVATKEGSFIYLQDVGYAHNGYPPQLNVVHDRGKKAVLMTVLKNGPTSTLSIVQDLRKILPTLQAAAPEGLRINLLFDQSVFVKKALEGVISEGVVAAFLTMLLILLFLGSWRSTTMIVVMIPLSLLVSIILLHFLGYTLNLMTLSGLALAIGILVDNAIVTIENIHRNLTLGKSVQEGVVQEGVVEGCTQIIFPTFVSTLAICIVFIPVTLLIGPARFLFVPFAFAVVFAIAASYLLSFTLLPVMAKYLLEREVEKGSGNPYMRFFSKAFERFRSSYEKSLHFALANRLLVLLIFGLIFFSPLLLIPFIGSDFFPPVYGNQIRLHVYAPTGTRLEVTSELFGKIEGEIQKVIPKEEIAFLINNIGIPQSAFNLAFGNGSTTGTWDGEILLAFSSTKSRSTADYMKKLNLHLSKHFPECLFVFQPANMITQILNFGIPTPIDVRVIGYGKNNVQVAQQLTEAIKKVPGTLNVHLHQLLDAPELFLNVNRMQLAQAGLTQHDVANDIVISYSDSTYITPNFWLDREMGIPYFIAVQTPKYRVDSIDDFMQTPIASPLTKRSELLSNLATLERRRVAAVTNHHNLQPAYDIYVNVFGSDLGSVASRIQKIIAAHRDKLEPGNEIHLRGLVEQKQQSFFRLGIGLIFAFVLVYFILVINFQSWLDPFIIITALPGAIAGMVWMLFLTHTTFNVPSLMGAIMGMGVAIANSILVVAFASRRLQEGKTSLESARTAATLRLRPVLMTALAMIVGMLPLAIAFGEAGRQNAPLGRALIGGLLLATFTTLYFVPVVFSYLHGRGKPAGENEKLP
jgi:multidrug efflux pump subunit AcrB